MRFLVILVVALFAAIVCGQGRFDEVASSVLVIVDSLTIRATHSNFFDGLKDQGLSLTFKKVDDPELALFDQGVPSYGSVLLFAPASKEFGGGVTVDGFLEFVDAGHNLVVASSPVLSEIAREVADECGAEFSSEGTYLVDHMSHAVSGDDNHNLLVSSNFAAGDNSIFFGGSPKVGPVLFRGIGHKVDPNGLTRPLITASTTAYSVDGSSESVAKDALLGKSAVLVSTLQARNGARVLIVGSLDFFSNELFAAKVPPSFGDGDSVTSGNRVVSLGLLQWVTRQVGVLRAVDASHGIVGDSHPSSAYRIKDNVEYRIRIEEQVAGKWVPYVSDGIQLEVAMLDPYLRLNLNATNGYYQRQFVLPDVYGIFTFRVKYERRGYTPIFHKDIVPVRPFRHDEYERFIPAAYPYYASAFSMLIGTVVFSAVFLFNK